MKLFFASFISFLHHQEDRIAVFSDDSADVDGRHIKVFSDFFIRVPTEIVFSEDFTVSLCLSPVDISAYQPVKLFPIEYHFLTRPVPPHILHCRHFFPFFLVRRLTVCFTFAIRYISYSGNESVSLTGINLLYNAFINPLRFVPNPSGICE